MSSSQITISPESGIIELNADVLVELPRKGANESSFEIKEEDSQIHIPSHVSRLTEKGVDYYNPFQQPRPSDPKTLRDKSQTFDHILIAKMIKHALKIEPISFNEFCEGYLKIDLELFNLLVNNPVINWEDVEDSCKDLYKKMSKFLQYNLSDRVDLVEKSLGETTRTLASRASSVHRNFHRDTGSLNQKASVTRTSMTEFRDRQNMTLLIDDVIMDLKTYEISFEDFRTKILKEKMNTTSILSKPVISKNMCTMEDLEKYLALQTWHCLPLEEKLKPFPKSHLKYGQ